MLKKSLVIGAVLAALAVGGMSTSASAREGLSPVFGNAKVAMMSKDATRHVTAKGSTTAYYLYYGMYYASYANLYASYAAYYNYFGYNGSGGATTSYAYNAYYYSYYATQNFYNAYYYSYYGY